MPPPEPDAAQLPKRHEVVNAIAAQLHPDRIGTGPLAMLRRFDPNGSLAEPALQRMLWQHVPEPWLDGDGMRRWALVIHAMAFAAPDLHLGRGDEARLGRALFAAGFSEFRLSRLLDARAEDLSDALPRVIRFLVAKRQAFDSVALAHFVFGVAAGEGSAEKQRERIARDYYRAERAANPDAAKAA